MKYVKTFENYRTNTTSNNTMTVQDLIDELMEVDDKAIHIELCDLEGDRFLPVGCDIITDGEDSHERNFDINFNSLGNS